MNEGYCAAIREPRRERLERTRVPDLLVLLGTKERKKVNFLKQEQLAGHREVKSKNISQINSSIHCKFLLNRIYLFFFCRFLNCSFVIIPSLASLSSTISLLNNQ